MSRFKTVILLSGGLDSAILASLLAKKGFELFPLFINYGQRAAELELKSCIKICKFLKIKSPQVIDVHELASVGPDNELTVGQSASPVFPCRNLVLLSIAGTFASRIGSLMIAIGIIRASTNTLVYPDCTPQFVDLAAAALRVASDRNISVITPLADMTKDQVIGLAKAESFPIDITYSCFTGKNRPCGKCTGCVARKSAISVIN